MEGLGYSSTKPLKVKVSTRNIPFYRDPAVILIDQLRTIHVEGELDVSNWPLGSPRLREAITPSA